MVASGLAVGCRCLSPGFSPLSIPLQTDLHRSVTPNVPPRTAGTAGTDPRRGANIGSPKPIDPGLSRFQDTLAEFTRHANGTRAEVGEEPSGVSPAFRRIPRDEAVSGRERLWRSRYPGGTDASVQSFGMVQWNVSSRVLAGLPRRKQHVADSRWPSYRLHAS